MATKTHKAKAGNEMTTITLTRSCKEMLADKKLHPRQSYEEVIRLLLQPDYHCVIQHGYSIVSVGRSASEALDSARQYLSTPDLVCNDGYDVNPKDGWLYLLPCDKEVYDAVMATSTYVCDYDVIDGRVCYCKDVIDPTMPDYHCVIQHGFCLMSVGRSASEALDSARQYLSTPDLIYHEDYVNPVNGHMYLLPCNKAVYEAVMSDIDVFDYDDIDVFDYDVIDGRVCYCKDVIDPTMPTTAYMGIVEDMRALADNCTAYLIRLTDADNVTTPIPVIIYSDGYQYTPHDWQTGYDEIPTDITSIRWVSQDGAEAIMIDGLPHFT